MRRPVDEAELIRRAGLGDQDAFAQLVQANAGRVHATLRRLGLDADEAQDVAQEVFMRAWRALPRFEGRAQLSTWLYRITFNEAQRRLSRRPPPSAAPSPDGEDPVAELAQDALLGPPMRALDREFEQTLERALADLPPDWRAAVVLRDIEGLSTREAAAVIGVRPAAFKSRLHRGRLSLRVSLEPYLRLQES